MVHGDQIIMNLVRLFASGRGLKISTASRLLTGSGDTVRRMERDGMSLTARRASRIFQRSSDNWPTDLPWPLDIPRPDPAPDSPAALAAAETVIPPEDAA